MVAIIEEGGRGKELLVQGKLCKEDKMNDLEFYYVCEAKVSTEYHDKVVWAEVRERRLQDRRVQGLPISVIESNFGAPPPTYYVP